MKSLQFLLDSQRKFQLKMGYDFNILTSQEKAKYIKEMMLWTIDELSEALHELPYAKDWSKKYDKSDYNHNQQEILFKEEMIDALHFFINILLAVGMNEEEIIKMYCEKNKVNYERQENNY